MIMINSDYSISQVITSQQSAQNICPKSFAVAIVKTVENGFDENKYGIKIIAIRQSLMCETI